MVDRAHALVAGVFVIFLGLGAAALAITLSGRHGERLPYIVVSQVPVSGLSPHSTVYFRGVPSGAVKSIALDPTDARQILVEVEIDQRIPVTRGSFATLRSQLVTGAAQLILDDDFKSPGRLPTSDDRPARIRMRPTLLDRLAELGPTVADRLTKLARSLDGIVSGIRSEDINRILTNTAEATAEFRAVGAEIRRQLQSAPRLGRDAQRVLSRLSKLTGSLVQLSGRLATTADGATRLAKAGEAASQGVLRSTLPKINSAVEELEQAARSVDALARLLREQPQALIQGSSLPSPGPGEAGYRASPTGRR